MKEKKYLSFLNYFFSFPFYRSLYPLLLTSPLESVLVKKPEIVPQQPFVVLPDPGREDRLADSPGPALGDELGRRKRRRGAPPRPLVLRRVRWGHRRQQEAPGRVQAGVPGRGRELEGEPGSHRVAGDEPGHLLKNTTLFPFLSFLSFLFCSFLRALFSFFLLARDQDLRGHQRHHLLGDGPRALGKGLPAPRGPPRELRREQLAPVGRQPLQQR